MTQALTCYFEKKYEIKMTLYRDGFYYKIASISLPILLGLSLYISCGKSADLALSTSHYIAETVLFFTLYGAALSLFNFFHLCSLIVENPINDLKNTLILLNIDPELFLNKIKRIDSSEIVSLIHKKVSAFYGLNSLNILTSLIFLGVSSMMAVKGTISFRKFCVANLINLLVYQIGFYSWTKAQETIDIRNYSKPLTDCLKE